MDPLDTDPQIEAMVVTHWRSVSVTDRADTVRRLCRDVEVLARVQIAAERPTLDEVEVCHELARRRYGRVLADAAYAGRIPPG